MMLTFFPPFRFPREPYTFVDGIDLAKETMQPEDRASEV
jgi:hypothetical protein